MPRNYKRKHNRVYLAIGVITSCNTCKRSSTIIGRRVNFYDTEGKRWNNVNECRSCNVKKAYAALQWKRDAAKLRRENASKKRKEKKLRDKLIARLARETKTIPVAHIEYAAETSSILDDGSEQCYHINSKGIQCKNIGIYKSGYCDDCRKAKCLDIKGIYHDPFDRIKRKRDAIATGNWIYIQTIGTDNLIDGGIC